LHNPTRMQINYCKNRFFIYFIPLLFIIWILIVQHINGYFYLYSIDPGYPYLINGLGISIFDFSRIGHVDHPGTPFQILTAIFLRITHFFAGQGSIVDDVIARPEMYLAFSSAYLTIITSLIILWLGYITYRLTQDKLSTIIIQSSLFLHVYIMDVLSTYIPERLLVILILLFIGLILKYFYDIKYSPEKFAIYSGLLMAIAVITKISFLPIVIIGYIILKNKKTRLIYSISFIVSSVLSLLPIYKKLSYFKRFVFGLITHDGLYGKGEEQIINPDIFIHNIYLIFKQNISYSIVFVLSVLVIIFFFIVPEIRKKQKNEFLMLIAFVVIGFIGTIIVAKHYKNHYLMPQITFSGLIYFLILNLLKKNSRFKYWNVPLGIVFLSLIAVPLFAGNIHYKRRAETQKEKQLFAEFCRNNISGNDYFLLEPTWLSGPIPENGLIFGFSYAAKNNLYYNSIENYYPNVLTWEGDDRPLRFFRMIDANIQTILRSGKSIYILSTPLRHASMLCNYLERKADSAGISFARDTAFSNVINNKYLINYSNLSNWKTVASGTCGFENKDNDLLFTNAGDIALTGLSHLSSKSKCNGIRSAILNNRMQMSPSFRITGIAEGDYLEFSIKHSIQNTGEDHGEFVISSNSLNPYKITETYNSPEIKPGWILQRINVEITKQPKDSIITCCFTYSGKDEIYIDDFAFKHMSEY